MGLLQAKMEVLAGFPKYPSLDIWCILQIC